MNAPEAQNARGMSERATGGTNGVRAAKRTGSDAGPSVPQAVRTGGEAAREQTTRPVSAASERADE